MLTPLQSRVLAFLFEEERIGELGFFLTGGTALAAFHLHHRISEDLDLFIRRDDVDLGIVLRGLSGNLRKFGEVETALASKSFLRFFLHAPNGEWDKLKIEFAQDVPARIASPLTIGHVIVDSMEVDTEEHKRVLFCLLDQFSHRFSPPEQKLIASWIALQK